MPRVLAPADLTAQLGGLPHWRLEGAETVGGRLVRTVELASFTEVLDLVVEIGDEAEAMDHHPDIDIRYTRVRFALWTHTADGVTQLDVELAHRIEALLPR